MNGIGGLSAVDRQAKPISDGIKLTASNSADEVSLGVFTTDQSSKADISSMGQTLSRLYANASAYVQKEHLEPFSGYKMGLALEKNYAGAYIDVGKYNDYVFGKAADDLLIQAKKEGIELDRDYILAQLKEGNKEIATLSFDNRDRINKLGSNSVFIHLSERDIDNLTQIYITAKENNLESRWVESLASRVGDYNQFGSILAYAHIYPNNLDDETLKDPAKIAAAEVLPDKNILNMADEIRNKLKGDFGLGENAINHILNPRGGLRSASEPWMRFLSQLADVDNGYRGVEMSFPSTLDTPDPRIHEVPAMIASIKGHASSFDKTRAGEAMDLFEKYSGRLGKQMAGYLTTQDKDLLGQIYALAEKKGENLERVDQMAINLSLLRMQEAMTRSLLDTKPQESEKAGKDGKSETRHANTMQAILKNELARLSE